MAREKGSTVRLTVRVRICKLNASHGGAEVEDLEMAVHGCGGQVFVHMDQVSIAKRERATGMRRCRMEFVKDPFSFYSSQGSTDSTYSTTRHPSGNPTTTPLVPHKAGLHHAKQNSDRSLTAGGGESVCILHKRSRWCA